MGMAAQTWMSLIRREIPALLVHFRQGAGLLDRRPWPWRWEALMGMAAQTWMSLVRREIPALLVHFRQGAGLLDRRP